MKDPFSYIFRFCCDPGFNDTAELAALDRYVDEACVDDVAVFANVEELNTGHMSYEEQDVYLDLMTRVRDLLAPQGISFSVNQWHSVMHADLGKRMREDQHFRPMVDIHGRAAELCVCPLCEEWQRYIARLYARYAALEPSMVWVEDDFRLHNHDPLDWGGCFCEEHLRLYSERAGKPLTREEFIAGVLQPGEPHPYRKIWLDVSRETMLCAARAIGRAVRAVSSQVQVGLMSSAPYVHEAEGRDWHALLRELSQGTVPVDRIHLPGYQESVPSQYMQRFNMVSMMNRAMMPADTMVYPELENYPFSRYSKSCRFTRFQLLSSLALAPDGITIDLYDLNGNGIVWEEGYQNTLRQTKPYLNSVTAKGLLKGKRMGVQVLCCADSAYTLHTSKGASMEELYPQEGFWAGLLPSMGIPYVYQEDPASLHGEVVAAAGQVLRNWPDEVLEGLFENNFVLLTADAAETLCDRGLGHLAGLEQVRWMRQNEGEYAFEQVTNGREYTGRPCARASAVISCSDAVDVTYQPGAKLEEYTGLYDSFRRRTAAGQVVVNGRVLVYPFGRFESPVQIPPMLLNEVRAEILRDVLSRTGLHVPMVEGAPYLEPYCFANEERDMALYLIHAASDPVERVSLAGMQAGPLTVWRSENGGRAEEIVSRPTKAGAVVDLPLNSMETMLLFWQHREGDKEV